MDNLNIIQIENERDTSINTNHAEVLKLNEKTVDVKLSNRPGTYVNCQVLGTYFPKEKDKGILLLVDTGNFPVFWPFKTGSGKSGSNKIEVINEGHYDFSSLISNYNEFYEKVKTICRLIPITNPDFLMQMMYMETGRTFSPSIQNPSSNATGLIQFMPKTAIGLGTTVQQLKVMTNIEQLDWVLKYFRINKIKSVLDSLESIVSTVFYPAYKENYDKILPANVQASNNGISSIRMYANMIRENTKKYLRANSSSINLLDDGNIKLTVN